MEKVKNAGGRIVFMYYFTGDHHEGVGSSVSASCRISYLQGRLDHSYMYIIMIGLGAYTSLFFCVYVTGWVQENIEYGQMYVK